jgi:hypothetical protein
MNIGDLVTWNGRTWVLRGLEPMSVTTRHAHLEDEATGERVRAPLAEVAPAAPPAPAA